MNVTTNEEHLRFINFMKLIEESNTSEVLGSFCADHAALFTVSKNLLTNELSLSLQKDGNPIYSLIYIKKGRSTQIIHRKETKMMTSYVSKQQISE